VEQTPASIVITDRAGNIEYVNAYFETATGYTKAEAVGKNPRLLKSGTTPPETYSELWRVISGGREWRGELCNRRKNGELYWEYAAISGLTDGQGQVSHYIAVKDDITDRKRIEEALRVSLHEKESLLKETHHRVKNNLALIASLMRLEAGRSREPETKAVLTEMQTRIRSVVLLNETLYKTASYARVSLADYVRQVATHVFQAQNSNSGSVKLDLDLEAVEVETGQAIPCGLIVNELLTNSLKHAFLNGRSGAVRVALRQQGDGLVCLRVSDTGAGLPEDFASRQGNSLGLQLVSDLARQLLGTLDVGPEATFTITFSPGPHGTGAIPRPTPARP
jgi:PAS domain S-box-containing protein